jgi:hypothetical protein
MFEIKSFDDLIGISKVLNHWKTSVKSISKGELLFIYGFSGVGKTLGTKLLIQECGYNALWIDTSVCENGKDIYDRILKFHNWSSILQQMEGKQKLIVIDELESLLKADRNILNIVLTYLKAYKEDSIPLILIGDTEIAKKLGDIKSHITESIYLARLQDNDIFLFLKKRLPRNKIKLNDLMKLAEDSHGNMYIAIKNIEERLKKRKSVYIQNYVGDEQRTFPEIFQCKNPEIVTKLLLEDNWMHPLKIHENSIKLLDQPHYIHFLKDYTFFEMWNFKSHYEEIIIFYYLAYIIIYFISLQKSDGKVETMDFSKLLSYISTQKKYKKLMYSTTFPIEDLGLHWMQFVKDK